MPSETRSDFTILRIKCHGLVARCMREDAHGDADKRSVGSADAQIRCIKKIMYAEYVRYRVQGIVAVR